jgi:hypothetical protein
VRRLLVLYWSETPRTMRIAIEHHLRAFSADASAEVLYYNTRHGAPAWLGSLPIDAVILHTTFLCLRWSHLFPAWKWQLRWINDLRCVKVAMPQDEYDHSEVLDEWLSEIGVSVIVTNFGEDLRPVLYPRMRQRATFLHGFTGYVDEAAARTSARRIAPIAERPFDVVYRASHLPYWFGSHGQLKHQIGEIAERAAIREGLRVDISTRTADTIVGERWLEFLMSGRAVIGCESGSSVLDRRGEIRARVQKLLRDRPGLTFEEVSERMPPGWDDYKFFAISPRHFEAVITKTCQVLVEGSYDGVLVPGRHYIPLRRDLSNLPDVMSGLRDHSHLQEVADCAYEEIYRSGRHSYTSLVKRIHLAIDEVGGARRSSVLDVPVWRIGRVLASANAGIDVKRPKLGKLTQVRRSTLLKGFLTVRLVWSSPQLRSFVWLYLRRPAVRRAVGLGTLMRDLLRLAIVEQAQRSVLTAYIRWPFRVSPYFRRDTGELTLKSWAVSPDGPHEPSPPDWASLEEGLRSGRVRRLTWDHSALGIHVPYGFSPTNWLSISVGERGIQELEAASVLIATQRDAADVLLRILRTGPKPRKPPMLPRVGHLRWISLKKTLLTIRLVASSLPLRSLLSLHLRRNRGRALAGLGALLRDLLRLAILGQIQRSVSTAHTRRLFQVSPYLDKTTGELVLRSSAIGSEGPDEPSTPDWDAVEQELRAGRVHSIVWDHSEIGNHVLYGLGSKSPLRIQLADDGIYRFEGLSALVKDRPEAVGLLLDILWDRDRLGVSRSVSPLVVQPVDSRRN